MMKRSVAALCFVGGLSSCSGIRFERDWKQALTHPTPAPAGCWEGHWKSDANGHTGKLRCLVETSGTDPLDLKFRYLATWQEFLQATFTINCRAVAQGAGRWKVTGTKDLGSMLGGAFSHQGAITPQTIRARYTSRLDQGVMELERPVAGGEVSPKSASPAH